jgi:hypothetical protein
LVNEVGGIKGFGNSVKVRIKRYEGGCEIRGDVRGGAHNEVIGESEKLESNKLDKAKIVRKLPNDVAGVHWKGLGELVLPFIRFRYLRGIAEILFWDPLVAGR